MSIHWRNALKQNFLPALLLIGWGSTGCQAHGRFKDQPVVWKVDDKRSISEPEERKYELYAQPMDWFLMRRLNRVLEFRDQEIAHNINSLGEVPDSTWFTNRIGIRDVSPKEAALAASHQGPPVPPLQVVGGKAGGHNPGFFAKDSTGRKFVIKFDSKNTPKMQTGINTMVNRIFWTAGYNVANDTIFHFVPSQVSVAPGSKLTDEVGDKRPITQEDIDNVLKLVAQSADGTYRATASQFIDGIPKGGWSTEGVREDDPNDTIPHEHRREVRGWRTFSAWVNHTDIKEDNTLDAYVEEDGRKFIKHYLVDFGEALAGHAAKKDRFEDGYEHWLDWYAFTKGMFTFGLWVRTWEPLRDKPWPAFHSFSADYFDPTKWKEAYNYWPFAEADAGDEYWAAKIIMRFDRPVLDAIIQTGELGDPASEKYLADTLIRRRDLIGRAYIQTVTALDYFKISPQRLCATDLSVRFNLVDFGVVELLDDNDEPTWDRLVASNGDVCIPIPAGEGYHVYRLRTRRRAVSTPVMQIHFRSGKNARVLGVVRIEEHTPN